METKKEYLIKVKIPKLIFFIFISLAIPTYLLIATQMNPAVFIFFLLFFMGIYHLINSWHDVYIEDNKMVFHKSILFNTRILIPINDINKCVIHYREYPRGDSSWVYIENINNEVGTFHVDPSSSEFFKLESYLKENFINYTRVYRNWNAFEEKYKNQNIK